MKYRKIKPRIDSKFINSDTDELLNEFSNRNWMNIGDIFVEGYVTQVIKSENSDNMPKKIMVIAVAEYELVDD